MSEIRRLQMMNSSQRPLTDEEKNILDCLATTYFQSMITLDSDKVIEHAGAVLKVEGLITRLKESGLVSPVINTMERFGQGIKQ